MSRARVVLMWLCCRAVTQVMLIDSLLSLTLANALIAKRLIVPKHTHTHTHTPVAHTTNITVQQNDITAYLTSSVMGC